MIEELRIRDLGVIEDAVLPLGPGLTVLTGETGAGKTMVLSALGLLCGGRADPGLVRVGAERADVEGRISTSAARLVEQVVRDAGGDLDEDGSLLISRIVPAAGRGRSTVGGRGVPSAVLVNVGGELVAVHGQHDQVRLLSAVRQREALDRFGGGVVASAVEAYAECLGRWRAAARELAEIVGNARERARQAEMLRAGIAAIERVAPLPDENVNLDSEAERLTHVEVLRDAAEAARAAITGDDVDADATDALSLIAVARRALDAAAGVDPVLDEAAARTAALAAAAADLAADLSTYVDRLDADPARLQWVHERRAAIRGLLRAYGDDVNAVLGWAQEARESLRHLDDDGRAQELTTVVATLRREAMMRAGALTEARSSAAVRLTAAVNAELPALAMGSTTLVVDVEPQSDDDLEHWALHGVDDVTFSLVTRDDAVPRPLSKGASGGELSRLMLALEIALSGADPLPTMVFDEVDSGVGGRAATEIGRRLAVLGQTTQVIVVTHLAQVAAFADRHLVVAATTTGSVRSSDVRVVEGDDRVRELARMLAGLEDSAAALAHASELRELATRESIHDVRTPTKRSTPRKAVVAR